MSSEWKRRYLAEFVGTFAIVFAPVALASASMSRGDKSLGAAAWVSGLIVMVMIYALGSISAAHFNPAVTLAFASVGRFSRKAVLPYWMAQFLGGIAASAVCVWLFGSEAASRGAHDFSISLDRALFLEALLTFFLMLVIMAIATDRRAQSAASGLAIGMTVVVDVWIGGSLTGGSMNPARSLGPALFGGGTLLAAYAVYLFGPILGALAAARLYEILRGDAAQAKSAPE